MCFNRLFRRDMSLLFGEGYKVQVNYVKYSTNKKTYIIDCSLMSKEPQLCLESYPYGLEIISKNSWSLLGRDNPIILSSTIDLIED